MNSSEDSFYRPSTYQKDLDGDPSRNIAPLSIREATQKEMDRQRELSAELTRRESETAANTPSRLEAFKARQAMPDSPAEDLAQWTRGISASKDAANKAASDSTTASQTNTKGAETESYSLSPPPATPSQDPSNSSGGGSPPQSLSTMVMDICVDGVPKKVRVYVDGNPY
jgi:hypothetical protein